MQQQQQRVVAVAFALACVAALWSAHGVAAVDVCPAFGNLGYSCGSCIPADNTVECSASTSVQSLGRGVSFANGGNAFLSNADTTTPGACTDQYTIQRRWSGPVCKNAGFFHDQIINVIDTTPPQITCSQLVINVPSAQCNQLPAFDASVFSATDNCDNSVAITHNDPAAFQCGQPFTRVVTATDNCGNTASVTQTINVPCCPTTPVCTNGVREFICVEGNQAQYYSCWSPYEELFRACPPGTRCMTPGRYPALTQACCPQGFD